MDTTSQKTKEHLETSSKFQLSRLQQVSLQLSEVLDELLNLENSNPQYSYERVIEYLTDVMLDLRTVIDTKELLED